LAQDPGNPAPGEDDKSSPVMALAPASDAQLHEWSPELARSRGIYGFDSLDPRSRAFNMIRAKLLDLRAERGWRLFGIASATPNVGKSFIAANVAASLSRDPRVQTTAVDLDLRRASLTNLLGIEPQVSIRAYLEGQPGADAPTLYGLEGERLLVLPTTAGPIRSAELLAGSRAQSLLRGMRVAGENSIFIADLPPVFANDDAATTMARLDAYIIVVEEGKTTQREMKDVAALLGTSRLAGVILNKYRGGLVSEGYGFDSYYAAGYGADTKESDD
jgi:Mrp family chromosome partitioning ATPase